MAKLSFKYGAMNSGKSTALINTAFNYEERGLNIAVVKPSVDTKGDSRIVARAGLEREVDFLVTPEDNIRECVLARQQKLGGIACTLVDEAQFLQEHQVDQLLELAKLDEISVVAYGLRTDFRRNLFNASKRLFELADVLEKLPTMCSCGSQAEFNTRKVNGVYIFEGSQIAIDGEDEVRYDSLCGSCYLGQYRGSAI